MDYFYHILLGLIQGVTEFLPISSSGHLVLFQQIMGSNIEGNTTEIIAHLGTLLAIIIYFRHDFLRLFKGLFTLHYYFDVSKEDNDESDTHLYIVAIIIATIPTGIIGLLGKKQFENIFESVGWVAFGFLMTSLILLLSRFRREKLNFISLPTAFIIGVVQGIAILPGISRSGITIVVALLLGIKLKEAFKFSFFIAIPVILAASLLELIQLSNYDDFELINLLLLMSSSTIFGYIALHFFERHIQLDKYARYTFSLAVFTFLWYIF